MENNIKKILVIGDIILDEYVYVNTTRMSQEADVPVFDELRTEYRLGGAANVASNIKSLFGDNADVHMAGIVGNDECYSLLKQNKIDTSLCFGSKTLKKRRYVNINNNKEKNATLKIVFRSDNIKYLSNGDLKLFNLMTDSYLDKYYYDAVIISDYDKGTVTENIAKKICNLKNGFVVVDSKRYDLRMYKGATILKLNHDEYSIQVSNKLYNSFESMFKYCVVTMGEKGSQLRMCEWNNGKSYKINSLLFPIEKKYPVDVTGCGDTHTAAMTYKMLINEYNIFDAIQFANLCASNVVCKFGTSTLTLEDLKGDKL